MRLPALLLASPFCLAADLADPAWLDHLHPALSEAGIADLARIPDAARGELDADLDESLPGLRGVVHLRWVNPGPGPASELVLQLWPNAPQFHGAQLTLTEVRLAGTPVDVDSGDQLLRLPLPAPLPVGDAVELSATVTAALSPGAGFHGLMRRTASGELVVYAPVPEPGVRGADGAWIDDPLAGQADALRTRSTHWLLRIRMPARRGLIAPGSELARRPLADGRVEVEIAAPLSRNLCLLFSDALTAEESTVDGIAVRAWHGAHTLAAAKRVLDHCGAAIHLLGAAVGPYPWREFDAVEAPLEGFVGGVEISGMVLIGRDSMEAEADDDPTAPPLALTARMVSECAAHETAHMWWHGIVGNDPIRAMWLDESLVNWAGGWVLEKRWGAALGFGLWNVDLVEALGAGCAGTAIDRPTGDYSDAQLGGVVYGRGALMYQRIRSRLGDAAFFAALRDWTDAHRAGWATPADWHAWLHAHVPADLADEIEGPWMTGAGLTPQMLMASATWRPPEAVPAAAP